MDLEPNLVNRLDLDCSSSNASIRVNTLLVRFAYAADTKHLPNNVNVNRRLNVKLALFSSRRDSGLALRLPHASTWRRRAEKKSFSQELSRFWASRALWGPRHRHLNVYFWLTAHTSTAWLSQVTRHSSRICGFGPCAVRRRQCSPSLFGIIVLSCSGSSLASGMVSPSSGAGEIDLASSSRLLPLSHTPAPSPIVGLRPS